MRNNRRPLLVLPFFCAMLLCVRGALAAPPAAPEPKPLADGVAVQDVVPANAGGFPLPVQYHYTANAPCVVELTIQLTAPKPRIFPYFGIQITHGRQLVFDYHLDTPLSSYLFFPVLDHGTYLLTIRGAVVGTPYTIQMRQIKVETTEKDKAAALTAIVNGTASLLTLTPAKAHDPPAFAPAIESLVMAALDSDPAGTNHDTLEKDYIPWLKAQFIEVPTVQWNGQPVSGIIRTGSSMYCHAIATLALAEMAPHSPAAKTLAEQGADFLLAAQLAERRPAAWRAIPKTNPNYGGWRYVAYSMDADLSVSGWCIIALNACAVADIQPDGMREALKDGVSFVKQTSDRDGFNYYAHGNGEPDPIIDAIGSLVFQLYGEHSAQGDIAMAYLDEHLCAGTQADGPQDYPLYYAYYATRLFYLRGGAAWEAWRMSTIRQLVKLQNADGSWSSYHNEAAVGPRYATALSVLILRMCLNDEPEYLTQEVRGF